MKKHYSVMALIMLFALSISISSTFAAGPEILWTRLMGGDDGDGGYSLQETSDGGFILVGTTSSYTTTWNDAWLIKTDTNGNEIWKSILSGSDNDYGRSVQQTPDGGYIMLGETFSYGAGLNDFWLIKTDADGNVLWDKTYGSNGIESGRSVQLTSDGGYLLLGYTDSYGAGYYDFWLIKTDAYGNEIWDRTYGGNDTEMAESMAKTDDGGYIMVGKTFSYGAGLYDIWLVKVDADGNEIWDRTFGGSQRDYGTSVQQTSDGGYIILGATESYGAGVRDFWLIKTDSEGNESWDKTFGGVQDDYGNCVRQTSDGGYILLGYTASYGAGDQDFGVIKTDSEGNMIWARFGGGGNRDYGRCVRETSEGRLVLLGNTKSFGAGNYDLCFVELNNPPSKFSLISPSDGETVYSTPVRFEWEPAVDPESDAITYDLFVDTDPSFRNPVVTRNITDTSYDYYNPLMNHTTYYWKVLAKDDLGASTRSDQIFTFFTNTN